MKTVSGIRRRDLLRGGLVAAGGGLALAALGGCGETQIVEVIKEVPVEKLKEVTKEVAIEKIVTKIVEKIVTVEVAPKLRSVTLTGWTFAHLPRWHKANGDLFEKKTNVKTEWVGVSEIWDKLTVALQTGVGAPDLVDIEQGPMGRFLKGKIQLVDLKPMLSREGYWDKLVTSREMLYTWEGKTYGVEYALTPVVMYFNLSLFEKYGIDPVKGMETWDAFVESGAKLKSGSGGKTLITGTGSASFPMAIEPLMRQRGVDYFNAKGEVAIDDPKAIAIVQWLEDLRKVKGIADQTPSGPAFYGALKEEHYAAVVGADWGADFIRDNVGKEGEGKWRGQPLPVWADDPNKIDTSCWGGTGIQITVHSKFPEECWEYIKFGMLTVDGSVRRYKEISQFPAYLPAIESADIGFKDPWYGGQDLTLVFKKVAKRVPPQYQHPFRPELSSLWGGKVLPDVFSGKISVADGMKNVAVETRALIAKGG